MENNPMVADLARGFLDLSGFSRLPGSTAGTPSRFLVHPVTGLPNQFQMDQDLRAKAARFSLLILNLTQGIERIQRGHEAYVTEWVLYQTGLRLKGLLSESDSLYHIQDTEFVLRVADRPDEDMLGLVSKVLETIEEPHVLQKFTLGITGTLGGATYPEHGDADTLLHRAKVALVAAKERKHPSLFYYPELFEGFVRKADLHKRITRAIEAGSLEGVEGRFQMHFQPKLTLGKAPDGRFIVTRVEAEALIRWHHPERGWVLPSQFIPMAEETGLILPLGKWTLYQVAEKLAEWQQNDLRGVAVSVNLSPRQFLSDDIVTVLSRLIFSRGVDPSRLIIEVTETSLFEDPDQTSLLINTMKALGLQISVDDFGTGYSSLSLLHEYPLDELKVDRLFIEKIRENAHDRSIVSSLISLSQNLGLHLVAEGVDSPEVLELLFEMGCTGFQGWVFSRALPAAEFEAFCRSLAARDYYLFDEPAKNDR